MEKCLTGMKRKAETDGDNETNVSLPKAKTTKYDDAYVALGFTGTTVGRPVMDTLKAVQHELCGWLSSDPDYILKQCGDILSMNESQKVNSQSSALDKMRVLVKIIIRKGGDACQSFYEILREHQAHYPQLQQLFSPNTAGSPTKTVFADCNSVVTAREINNTKARSINVKIECDAGSSPSGSVGGQVPQADYTAVGGSVICADKISGVDTDGDINVSVSMKTSHKRAETVDETPPSSQVLVGGILPATRFLYPLKLQLPMTLSSISPGRTYRTGHQRQGKKTHSHSGRERKQANSTSTPFNCTLKRKNGVQDFVLTEAECSSSIKQMTHLIQKQEKENFIHFGSTNKPCRLLQGPAVKMIIAHKVKLIECLKMDDTFILQHAQEKNIVTDREYDKIKHLSPPEKAIIGLIDQVIGKGEESCSLFLEVLKQPDVLKTYPQLKQITNTWR